ncbi:helix-turn-helix transcriptional regulator [Bacillus mycoides]|uniref:helix-turn-helix transcriptional regulator n=1 Tax=Bacillus mycoides TaxID=1405 RepID=UPI0010BE9AF6|nr:helix-turn-helix transcriptional regulator [Bacillus mycoides]TKI39932.1 helix-turn-helix transcriptional regulator [Bacillus mycoides]
MIINKKALDKKEVGKRIKQIIAKQDYPLSYAELGKRLVNKKGKAVPKATVHSWIRGLALPSLDIIKQLALLGDTTVEWVYQGDIIEHFYKKETDDPELFRNYVETMFSDFDINLHSLNEDFYIDLLKIVSTDQISYGNESDILKVALNLRPSLLNDKKLKVAIK